MLYCIVLNIDFLNTPRSVQDNFSVYHDENEFPSTCFLSGDFWLIFGQARLVRAAHVLHFA